MNTPHLGADKIERLVRNSLKDHWKAFLAQGALLAALGALAIAAPNIASIAAEVFIGWLLFVVGIARIVSLGTATEAPGYWMSMLLGAITAALGAVLVFWPAQGLVTLTTVLIIYLIAHGISSILLGMMLRPEATQWLWIFIGGLIDFGLAAIILSGWPQSTTWVLGLLVGINLLFSGLGLAAAAVGARNASAKSH